MCTSMYYCVVSLNEPLDLARCRTLHAQSTVRFLFVLDSSFLGPLKTSKQLMLFLCSLCGLKVTKVSKWLVGFGKVRCFHVRYFPFPYGIQIWYA